MSELTPFDELTKKERYAERELARMRASRRLRYNPELAALLSLLVPGAGQLYLGERLRSLVLFLPSVLLLKWVIPWVAAAAIGALLAYRSGRLKNGQREVF